MRSLLNSSSKKVITSAIKTEGYHAKWYQELANRFGPFDPSVSCLFEALAEEDEKNKQELIKLAYTVDNSGVLKAGESEFKEPHIIYSEDSYKHFFVVNEKMALAILNAALKSEREAQHFYERCFFTEDHPLLRELYKRLSIFEEHHAQVLEESMERFHTDSDLRILRSLA